MAACAPVFLQKSLMLTLSVATQLSSGESSVSTDVALQFSLRLLSFLCAVLFSTVPSMSQTSDLRREAFLALEAVVQKIGQGQTAWDFLYIIFFNFGKFLPFHLQSLFLRASIVSIS